MIESEREVSTTMAELREVTDALAEVSERLAQRLDAIRCRREADATTRDRNVTHNFS